jgi:hypothetical protein
MSSRIHVEVVYALPLSQDWVKLELEPGATVRSAIEQSGILARHPEIDPLTTQAGVFGRRANLDAPLREGDRVEIYRALQADPKEIRRRRAARRAAKR